MKLERTRIRRKRWDLDTHDFRRIESMMEKKKKRRRFTRNVTAWNGSRGGLSALKEATTDRVRCHEVTYLGQLDGKAGLV